MKTWILKNKEITFWVAGIGIAAIFLFGYYLPKQDCISKIRLSVGTGYIYQNDDSLIKQDIKYFNTGKDAFSYCMAQRWDF